MKYVYANTFPQHYKLKQLAPTKGPNRDSNPYKLELKEVFFFCPTPLHHFSTICQVDNYNSIYSIPKKPIAIPAIIAPTP